MDKSLLIDRNVVAIIKSMRGHIRSEFGHAVSLTEDDLFAKLKSYADASRNEQLKKLHEQLEAMVAPPQPEPEPAEATPQKVYRGRVVETAATTKSAPESPRPSRSPRVYRGQRVSS